MRAPASHQRLGQAACSSTGVNALRPGRMTAQERLAEIAEILAAGLSRLKARQSSALSADFRESSLDCAADQSGPANILTDGDKA